VSLHSEFTGSYKKKCNLGLCFDQPRIHWSDVSITFCSESRCLKYNLSFFQKQVIYNSSWILN